MSVHVHNGSAWLPLCDSLNTLHVYKDAVVHQAKTTDHIWNGLDWQTICPNPTYPFGFDYPNRILNTILGGDFSFLGMSHTITHKDSGGIYPFGTDYDFIMTCNIDAYIPANPNFDIYLRAYTPADGYLNPVWTFAPSGGGTFTGLKTFPYNAANFAMKIIGEVPDGADFQISTEVLPANEPTINQLDWGGVPFPIEYDSND